MLDTSWCTVLRHMNAGSHEPILLGTFTNGQKSARFHKHRLTSAVHGRLGQILIYEGVQGTQCRHQSQFVLVVMGFEGSLGDIGESCWVPV